MRHSALLAELSGRLYYKAALALHTGLRWGEVHGLAWTDIVLDSDQPTLSVRRSFQGRPKNQASAATVPLGIEAAALLRRWCREQAANDNDPRWLFPGVHGRPLVRAPYADARKIHDATWRTGISKHVTPHVFRHTFGIWVYEQTGDPKIVQRLMRHASFHTSMLYVHDRRELSTVVDALPRLTIGMHLRAV
ncbi:MAG: site-specific integrase [Proteobacteria bacterium]|nr:site-specific integrase [Pseudomonadota bacterium]